MWPFKKKEKKWKPKSSLDYFLLGFAHRQAQRQELRKLIGRKPTYTPSKIIQPKQLTWIKK
jgi:hypothetical protein